MNSQDNHYTFLGLDNFAPSEEVAVALERLSKRANALSNTDPARSHEIRERLRRIRQDLLTTEERRNAYDNALLDALGPAGGRTRQDVLLSYQRDAGVETARQGLGPRGKGEWGEAIPQSTRNYGRPPVITSQSNRGLHALWVLGGALLLVLLAGGGGFAVARGAFKSARTATATATASPSVTPRPTPTVTPTTEITVTPAPQPTSAAQDPMTHDPMVIQAHNYTPSGQPAVTADGFGHRLYAWIGTCAGSADGHCQKVFFFIDTKYLGTDTFADSTGITNVAARGTATIAVAYPDYLPNDPLCCPSGPSVTVTYHWTGASPLVASGTPPGH